MAGGFRVQKPVDRGRVIQPTWLLSLLGARQLTGARRTVDVGTNGRRLFALLAVRGAGDRSYLSGVIGPDGADPCPPRPSLVIPAWPVVENKEGSCLAAGGEFFVLIKLGVGGIPRLDRARPGTRLGRHLGRPITGHSAGSRAQWHPVTTGRGSG